MGDEAANGEGRDKDCPGDNDVVGEETFRILVAEDNEVNQIVLKQILGDAGYAFVVVGNGQLAVEEYRQAPPDLVLMDVSMPEMNGLDATLSIRELENGTGEHVPIIGLTAHALKGDRELCLEVGMDEYLPKPISVHSLLAAIGGFLDGETAVAGAC
jgi:CheY-like chemotaxis protein